MTFQMPKHLIDGSQTILTLADFFGVRDRVEEAAWSMPRTELTAEARSIFLHARVISTGRKESCYGWYQRTGAERKIALTHLPVSEMGQMRDTFLHEVAHLLDDLQRGRTNHDANWKRWARIVGARPEACHEDPVFRAAINEFRKPVAQCSSCGRQWFRQRRKDFTGYTHLKCDGAKVVNVFANREEREKFSHYLGGYVLQG